MTDTSIRLFIALPLPPSLQRMLSDWSEELRLKLPFRKWVHPSDLHITLQFLGNTPSQQIDAIKSALRSGIANSPETFELKLERLRLFGRPDNPSVLWVGISGELGLLHALHQAVASVLAPLGYKAEGRPYHPHITLARKHNGTVPFDHGLLDHFTVPSSAPDGEIPGWTVHDIVLYSSSLNQPPPLYTELQRLPLL